MNSEKFEVLAPLFSFRYSGIIDPDNIFIVDYGDSLNKIPEDYIFFDKNIQLKNFNLKRDYPDEDVEFFSPYEKREIQTCKWAISLTENKNNHSDYSQKLNLLLLAFRIYFNTDCFVKYKLCRDNIENDMKLHHIFLKTPSADKIITNFRLEDIVIVDKCFKNIVDLFSISYRTRHALQYLYQGHIEYYAMSALILLFTSVESFYLPEGYVKIKEKLKERIPRFLKDEKIASENIIDELYTLRSDIVHGKIKIDLDMKELYPKLLLLQKILHSTLRTIFDNNLIKIYKSEESKEEFFN